MPAERAPGPRSTGAGEAARSGLPADVLLVSLGSTAGLRAADDALLGAMRRAGARAVQVRAVAPRPVRTLALTDLAWALAARRAAVRGLREHRPRAVLYSSVGAALLWPRPGAIRLDSPAAVNRPGRDGAWQRPRERALLRAAPLIVPFAAQTVPEVPAPRPAAVVVPHPVAASGEPVGWAARDLAAVAYVANPRKKGLDRVLAAWARARRPGEWLVLAGATRARVAEAAGPLPPGTHVAGPLEPEAFRALLRRARVLVHAPRREDHGQVPLEALADGCRLVTGPAAGPHVALGAARALAPDRVAADLDDPDALARALRSALDAAPPDAAERDRVRALLEPLGPAAVDRVVAERLLPALLGD